MGADNNNPKGLYLNSFGVFLGLNLNLHAHKSCNFVVFCWPKSYIMKIIVLLVSFITLLMSCQIQYDGETKLVVTGKIQDEMGVPISNQKVVVTIGNEGAFTSSDEISYGVTNENGFYTLIFPAPKGEYRFEIDLNTEVNQWQEKTLIAKQSNFSNYKLDLNTTILYNRNSITSLFLNLNKVSTNKQLKNVVVEGLFPNPYFFLYPQIENDFYIQTNYSIIKNQNLVLKYTIVDYSNAGQEQEYDVTIPVKSDAITYMLSY